ncbi:hypothetical protein BpHYR1_003699 [Brachionus plicatilis]|uniref:Uncharacterized protein n=1 Tax=Brachionus plicatilis TaxID=10195 RepID=A0A3M7RE40_BRAPC|nr:hypothetical protein BpHYR1_003699 [Brachionus plicatilis]
MQLPLTADKKIHKHNFLIQLEKSKYLIIKTLKYKNSNNQNFLTGICFFVPLFKLWLYNFRDLEKIFLSFERNLRIYYSLFCNSYIKLLFFWLVDRLETCQINSRFNESLFNEYLDLGLVANVIGYLNLKYVIEIDNSIVNYFKIINLNSY